MVPGSPSNQIHRVDGHNETEWLCVHFTDGCIVVFGVPAHLAPGDHTYAKREAERSSLMVLEWVTKVIFVRMGIGRGQSEGGKKNKSGSTPHPNGARGEAEVEGEQG
jgi:hypothetical protein